jgi:hypothetical protein
MTSPFIGLSPAVRPWLDTVHARVGTAGVHNVGVLQTVYLSSLQPRYGPRRSFFFFFYGKECGISVQYSLCWG